MLELWLTIDLRVLKITSSTMLIKCVLGIVGVDSVFQNVTFPRTSGLKTYKNVVQKPEVLFLPALDANTSTTGKRYIEPVLKCITKIN